MIRKMIPLGGGDLHGNWEQTVTGIWMFKMTGGSYAKNRWGRGVMVVGQREIEGKMTYLIAGTHSDSCS